MISFTSYRRDYGFQFLLVALVIASFFGCKEEIVSEVFQPRNDHEAYAHALKSANLSMSALGKDWLNAADNALQRPVTVEMPLSERLYVDDREAKAFGYRFEVKRGQHVQASIGLHSDTPLKLFVDVFRVNENAGTRHVASASKGTYNVEFEPRADGEYILRIQPELLRGGEVNVSIRRTPAFGFPVVKGKTHDIGSFFGDPRDGGRRKHHGIDIFARRHTPIIAPVDGRVRFTGERGLGGLVVWLRDQKRDMSIYFAHLHEIKTRKGAYVSAGDTIGTVGNTGNARRTPPHLHFGIYQNGPIDPYHFVARSDREISPFTAIDPLLGMVARTRIVSQMLRYGQGTSELSLLRHQHLKVLAVSDDEYRVRLPSGEEGYISKTAIETIEDPIRRQEVESGLVMRSAPSDMAPMVSQVQTGNGVHVLAINANYAFVDDGVGNRGWVLAAP